MLHLSIKPVSFGLFMSEEKKTKSTPKASKAPSKPSAKKAAAAAPAKKKAVKAEKPEKLEKPTRVKKVAVKKATAKTRPLAEKKKTKAPVAAEEIAAVEEIKATEEIVKEEIVIVTPVAPLPVVQPVEGKIIPRIKPVTVIKPRTDVAAGTEVKPEIKSEPKIFIREKREPREHRDSREHRDHRDHRDSDHSDQGDYGEPDSPEEELSYPLPSPTSRLVIGFKGLDISPGMERLLRTHPVGGVMLFTENFDSPAQLAETINYIQELSRDHYKGLPILVAVDHEGGRVQRFTKQFTLWPSAKQLAASDNPQLVTEVADIMAKELKHVGINWNFAPVADINLTGKDDGVIGDRAFGNNSERVCKMVLAMIRGFQKNQFLSCAKHFPGHGGTSVDSHLELPVLDKSYDELRNQEFQPFHRAVKAGVSSVMLAHMVIPQIDSLPASLSAKWVEILRQDFRFRRLICTDDMEMKAISKNFTPLEAVTKALNAGVDLVLYRNEQVVLKLADELAKSTEINMELHAQSIRRLHRTQKYLPAYREIYIPNITGKIGVEASQQLARVCLDSSGKAYQNLKNPQKQNQEKERPKPEIQLTAPGGRDPRFMNRPNNQGGNSGGKPMKRAHAGALSSKIMQHDRRQGRFQNNNRPPRPKHQMNPEHRPVYMEQDLTGLPKDNDSDE